VNCSRDVRGVIYCENCLAARLEANQIQASQPSVPYAQPVVPGTGPNPTVAGILAGFFPFGVGSVYSGQYAKGLAHLIIFVLLIMGMSHGGGLATFCALAFAGFYIYQIIDAARSARAIQLGLPAPDPFGLAQTFGAGDRVDTAKIPTGAIVLIGLGVLFLLQTMGLFDVNFDRIWPIFLIGLGVWLFARNYGLVNTSRTRCYCDRCSTRRLMGPAVLITIGTLSLLEDVTRFGWERTWPVLILVIGLVKLLQSNASDAKHIPRQERGSDSGDTGPGAAPGSSIANQGSETPQSSANEVKNV
jgi:hypothetical protein